MKVSYFVCIIMVICIPFTSVLKSQTNTEQKKFSLSEARQYALDNSPVLLNSARDVDIAKMRIWETIATGLPQAEINGTYTYAPQLAGLTDLFAGGDTTGGGGGENPFGFDFNADDLKTNFFFTGQASLLLFNGQYFIGLKASKVYAGLSELANTKSKVGITESVTVTYVTALVAREAKSILDSTLTTVQKTMHETEQLYKNGFVESTDIDQLKILVSNIRTNLSVATRQIDLMERLLKFQMGLPIDQPVILTDELVPLIELLNAEAGKLDSFKIENNLDYLMLSTQEKLLELNLKAQKALFLPTIAGFYQRYEDFDNNFFNDQSPNTFGLTLNFPVFSSGQRLSQLGQRRVEYLKAKTNTEMAAENLLIQYETAISDFLAARDIFAMQKESRDLSLRIYQRAITKFTEGVGSSLDLNQTQSQYFETQAGYFNAVVSLVSTKSKLESLLAISNNANQ